MMIIITEKEREILIQMMAVPMCCMRPASDCPEPKMQLLVDTHPTPLLRAVMAVYQDGRACPGPDIRFQVEVALGIDHPNCPVVHSRVAKMLSRCNVKYPQITEK